jgi:hypothetical protein
MSINSGFHTRTVFDTLQETAYMSISNGFHTRTTTDTLYKN